jgi:hypothetical protein
LLSRACFLISKETKPKKENEVERMRTGRKKETRKGTLEPSLS